jgi:iron complex outermembrane receptor protein
MSSAYAETAPATDATTPAQAAPSVPTAPGTPAATGSALPTTNAATVTVTGKKVGMGLMVQEDAPKARSTVTAEELAKQRTTGNVYDALALMPSVNTYSYDGTGLFGGGLTLRGFNSDQVGVTINGVPVNDSGSFTVFPQEYVDAENTCSEYVTQGSTDVDSPQVGATGGNIGITTCDPEDVQRFRFAQTLGQLNLAKTYLRYDTGRFAHDYAKFFVSYSHAEADKWKGFGGAKRDHVDMGFNWDWDKFNYIHGTILFNSAVNNNINSISLADLKANGYYYDYSGTFQGHAAPSPGKAVTDPAPSASGNSYYALSLNPFEDVIASATAKFRLNDSTDIKIVPYYWYGYGTGGVEQKQLSESGFLNSATGKVTSGVDLNGDGDTLDKVTVYSGSVTRTQRPGVTASVTENIGDHQILGGIWYERATHRQTGPAELVDGSGGGENVWLQGQQIFRPDGTPYESRNWTTISTAYQAYLQDTISLMDNKLLVNVGVRDPHVKRDFTNFANETTPLTYRMVKTYDDLLPQFGVRYRITNDDQLFASYAKNFRAPPNFVYAATSGDNVVITNGVAKLVTDVQPETSWDLDVGYRHQGTLLTTSATMFFTNFKNRQANATDPNTQISTYTNVGNVKNKGFELEAGNTPINGWTVYGSLGYLNTRVQSNLAEGVGTNGQPLFLPTAGNQFPLSPKWKAAISTSYETDAWYARVSAKMTSTQQATLVNDELVPGYTTLNLDAGYQFPSFGAFKNPKLTLNVTNLLSHQYRDPSGQITNENAVVTPNGTVAKGGTVFYYLGAPRLISMNLRMDF